MSLYVDVIPDPMSVVGDPLRTRFRTDIKHTGKLPNMNDMAVTN
ncbi:hypothetical protein GCM10011504_58750 [Siccirubricoccus deserti]|nr:hypothetical protein GCM10011504_58750 [Siccirubricoccus deserti]